MYFHWLPGKRGRYLGTLESREARRRQTAYKANFPTTPSLSCVALSAYDLKLTINSKLTDLTTICFEALLPSLLPCISSRCCTEDELLMTSVKEDCGSTMSERIRPIWEDLVSNLQYAEDITEQLELTRTLTSNEVEVIQHKQNTPREVKRKLLGAIQKRKAYDVFAQCLRVTDQEELYQHLVSTGPVQPVTDELSTLQYRVYCKHEIGDPKEIQVPPHIQQLLETQREALQEIEKVERLVDLMEEEECLTSEMTSEIKQQPGYEGKVNMLVDRVKESTLYSYFALTKFLDISQQKEFMLKIIGEDIKTALERMDDLLRHVYYNLLGAIALEHSELETRLGITAREFVTLSINSDSNAVDRRGFNEAHVDQSKAEEIKLTDMFSDQENKEKTKQVLLIGAPGTGKTTAATRLARVATTKKALNVPRPPFIILLRSIDWKNHTSLKKLLLNHGPELKEEEPREVWKALSKHADDVTVILDGADEVPGGFFKRQPGQVAGEESEALPQDILNNLISGKLLKGARVLVSTRPFDLESCWDNFSRKVEVVGFNEESLDRFLSNELPEKIEEVQSFLATHVDIKSLLLIPLHAATFVLHAKNPQHTDDWLLQSRTELSLSLVDTLVKTKLRKDHGGRIRRVDLKKTGKNLIEICKLVAELLCRKGAIKTEMTSEDLEKAKISVDECVATGVYSEQVVDDDGVSDSTLIVPHQSILESLAALGLEEEQIVKLVADNDGRHDLVLTYVAGILGNEKNRKMLKYVLIEEDQEKDFKKLAATVVRAILGSKRRVLPGGQVFCQRIVVESQQWDLIEDLMRVMGRRWLESYSTVALMLADQLVQHDPRGDTDDPLVRVEVRGISAVRYCPRAAALCLDDDATAADIAENVEHLGNITAVSFSPMARITQETAAKLSKLNNVKAVNMEDSKVRSASDESSALGGLSSISSLQFLRLSHCGLSSDDVVAVTSSCRRLLHLDISRNRGVREGDVRSRKLTGLDVAGCRMEGEELVELAATNGETLTYLNATRIYCLSLLTSSHINAILTRCPRLVEMYTEGGELVRALSERRAACRLNHLWLRWCDLSSSSSSGRRLQVNSSELSDVITRHSSISSLTLYECRYFTPDVISHLSSSMAAITKLYISHPDHPPPRPSDVASLVCASRGLKQLWLDGVHDEWRASDYMEVIDAINASPALCVVGLDVEKLTVDEVGVVVRAMTRPLTRLWLRVDYRKEKEMEKIVLEKEPGVVQLVRSGRVNSLYSTYERESGSFLQHLPSSLPDHFRHDIW